MNDPGHLSGWPYPDRWVAATLLLGVILMGAGAVALYRHIRRRQILRGLGLYALSGLAACAALGVFYRVATLSPASLGEIALLVLRGFVLDVLKLWLALGLCVFGVASLYNRATPRRRQPPLARRPGSRLP